MQVWIIFCGVGYQQLTVIEDSTMVKSQLDQILVRIITLFLYNLNKTMH